MATTDKTKFPQSVLDAVEAHSKPSFDVVVERVVGTVELGGTGSSALVAAFKIIGEAVTTSKTSDVPMYFRFPFGGDIFKVTVDAEEA